MQVHSAFLHSMLLISSLFFTASADAQPMPPGRGGPGAHVPSAEMLAVVPDLTVAQQQEIRRIAIEQRDAMDALRQKTRTEHDAIDDRADARLRKLLGDDGFRKFAEWKFSRGHGRPGGRGGPGARGQHYRHDGKRDGAHAAPDAQSSDADDASDDADSAR